MYDPASPPLWHHAAGFATLTPEMRAWLLDAGSLTRRLTELADGGFSLSLLAQGWQVPRVDESAALGLLETEAAWVREVLLCGNGRPWVFARSVAGPEGLRATGFSFDALGSSPLGERLFQPAAFARGPLQVALWPADGLPAEVEKSVCWARRSGFQGGALSILVTEVFLPALWRAAGLPDAVETQA